MKLFSGSEKNKGVSEKTPPTLTNEQKEANLSYGLNEDGSTKEVILTDEQKQAHLAAGLNEDGSKKDVESVTFNTSDSLPSKEYIPTEMVIKEMMIQKGCGREEAIHRLKNPN